MLYWQRTMCEVLDEMRSCFKTYNFAPIQGLIEEIQVMANRMENKLGLISDFERLEQQHKELREKCKQLNAEED